MKISDLSNEIKKLQGGDVKKPEKGAEKKVEKQSAESAASSGDTVNISTRGELLNKIESAINSSVDTPKTEKIARIKREIDSGSYKVDSQKIARKMLEMAISETGISRKV